MKQEILEKFGMKVPKMILFDYGQTLGNEKFDGIRGTEAVLHKRIFELALEKAGLQPEDVWYIGDQYKADVEGARNAKITPVWYMGAIDLPYEKKDDVLTVRSWTELKECLE